MHSENFIWLYLEPFVHISTKKGNHLFYNSISKKILEFSSDPVIDLICLQLSKPENGYVIPISEKDLQLSSVKTLIKQIKRYFMGDTLNPDWSNSKPVNILPLPAIKRTNPESTSVLGDHLKEVFLHLNSGPGIGLKKYGKAIYQFPFPMQSRPDAAKMRFNLIQTLFNQVKELSGFTWNILGSEIFQYPEYNEMVTLLNKSVANKRYLIPFEQFNLGKVLQIRKRSRLTLFITFPVTLSSFENTVFQLSSQEKRLHIEFTFIVLRIYFFTI